MSFDIKKIETAKSQIFRRQLMEKQVIPSHPNVVLFNAAQGSGKTNLAANLLLNPLYYGLSNDNPGGIHRRYFDAIFLMIGSMDDMYDHLIKEDVISENHVCEMPTSKDLKLILDKQNSIIKEHGIENSPKLLVICDDLINDKKLMKSKEMATLFIKGRHLNISVWLMTQYLNSVPRPLRLQSNYMFIFKPLRVECDILFEQFSPQNMDKKVFNDIVKYCTEPDEKSKHNFMVIVKRAQTNEMFRKNIVEYVHCVSDPKPERVKIVSKDRKKKNEESERIRREVEKQTKELLEYYTEDKRIKTQIVNTQSLTSDIKPIAPPNIKKSVNQVTQSKKKKRLGVPIFGKK